MTPTVETVQGCHLRHKIGERVDFCIFKDFLFFFLLLPYGCGRVKANLFGYDLFVYYVASAFIIVFSSNKALGLSTLIRVCKISGFATAKFDAYSTYAPPGCLSLILTGQRVSDIVGRVSSLITWIR